jgi:colanic acid/amylovoran biosynthesis glycosyltransferase
MSEKPVVAHLHGCCWLPTQTFIYNYVANHRRFRPINLVGERKTEGGFSSPEEDIYVVPRTYPARFSPAWFHTRLRGFEPADGRLLEILRERRAKLIHAHFGTQGVYAVGLKRKAGLPLATTFYGYDVSRLPGEAGWKRAYRRLFQDGELFLTEGPRMKARLVELGCPEEKVKIQRIPIPLEKIAFRARPPSEKAVLLFSGRFTEKKGLLYALEAVLRVRKTRRDFELRLIGDGELREEITSFISRNAMGEYVEWLGFLPYDRYVEEMEKADLFVHPSVTAADGDSEGGAPTTILEAQASGMPVIATFHADIPNVVSPGKSALLSRERDVEGLTANIIALLEDRGRWAEMGRAGRSFVEEFHGIDKSVAELEQKYSALLER